VDSASGPASPHSPSDRSLVTTSGGSFPRKPRPTATSTSRSAIMHCRAWENVQRKISLRRQSDPDHARGFSAASTPAVAGPTPLACDPAVPVVLAGLCAARHAGPPHRRLHGQTAWNSPRHGGCRSPLTLAIHSHAALRDWGSKGVSGPIALSPVARRERCRDDRDTGRYERKRAKPEPTAEQRAAEEVVARAREQGLSLTGPDGLLKQLTETLLEIAPNEELTEHLGHEKTVRSAAGAGRCATARGRRGIGPLPRTGWPAVQSLGGRPGGTFVPAAATQDSTPRRTVG